MNERKIRFTGVTFFLVISGMKGYADVKSEKTEKKALN